MKLFQSTAGVPSAPRRRGAGSLALAACLGMAAMLGSAAGASGAGAAAAACRMTALKVSVGSPNGAAGHIDYLMRFKNLSRASCTLRGYPKVVALNKAGRRLGSPAAASAITKVKTVTLKPGGWATAPFSVTEAGNYPPSICGRIGTIARLRISLYGTKTIPFSSRGCTKPGPRYMSVGPVR